MTELEKAIKAKIPGPETRIEIRHSVCDICTPGPQCGLNVYVKDEKIIKIEGMPGFPGSNGKLCTKGASNRQYVYRKNRIQTPLKRIVPRDLLNRETVEPCGPDGFIPISWEEAYDLIAQKLLKIREQFGADSVAWFTGYTKWLRPWLRRLCGSFGSHNYMTESSTCYRSGRMACETLFGRNFRTDMAGKPQLVVAWAFNPLVNIYPAGRILQKLKKAGTKIIVIDVRHTQAAEKLADLFLQPHIGTDAVLSHAIAGEIIRNGWQDQAFIDQYAHGYEDYKKMVLQYDLETAEKITGVPKEMIRTAAQWIGNMKPAAISPSNGIAHHINGFNTYRAVMSLNVITGNVDKPGTILPVYDTFCDMGGGLDSLEETFMEETWTEKTRPQVGEERFPLFNQMTGDAQAVDLPRQILEGTPYQIHALAAFGVNTMIFPQPEKFREAMKKLDFIFATDLVWTEACEYADVILPVVSSLERSEAKFYSGGFFYYTTPAIQPLYEGKDDVTVMTELAKRLCPEDTLLCSGYDTCLKYMFQYMEDELDAGKASKSPYRSSHFKPYIPGTYLAQGAETPTGKLELFSERIASLDPSYGLNPLPEYEDGTPINQRDKEEEFPFTLMTGARLPHTIHSRGHSVPWLRSLRPDPMVDINPKDAKRLSICQGTPLRLYNETGEIHVLANITEVANEGDLHLIHGYREASASDLVPWDALDPYSGFPAYKQIRCNLEKEDKNEL